MYNDAVAVIVGVVPIMIFTVWVAVQPFVPVTTTEFTPTPAQMDEVVAPLGLQLYDPPPGALRIVQSEKQITVLPTIDTVGDGFTVMVIVFEPIQLEPLPLPYNV